MTTEILSFMLMAGSVGYIVSYLPQLHKLYHLRTRAEELSLTTLVFWVYATGATALWAIIESSDFGLILSSSANAVGCICMLTLTLFHRYVKGPMLDADDMSIPEILARRRLVKAEIIERVEPPAF